MGTETMFDGQPVVTFGKETDRRNFLKWAGLVGAGATFAAGGVAVAGSAAADAAAPSASGDLGILNYALTLEYLEADFYGQGLHANLLHGRELELVTPIAAH